MGFLTMPNVICSLAALAVASVFYGYRAYFEHLKIRQRLLRERVAYMLWVMATDAGDQATTPALCGARD